MEPCFRVFRGTGIVNVQDQFQNGRNDFVALDVVGDIVGENLGADLQIWR